MPMLMIVILSLTGFCQSNKYPKIVVINGDTITMINQVQVKKINLTFLDLKVCDTTLELKNQFINLMQEKTGAMQHQIILQNNIIGNDSLVKTKLLLDNNILVNENYRQKKKLAKSKMKLTISVVLNGVLAIISGITLYLAIK